MPWTYRPIPGYQFVVRIEDEVGGMMLVASHIKPGQEAGARRVLTLAAKAPELYERLESISAAFDHMMDHPHPEHPEMFIMRLEILLRGIPNLLAEARGETA